MYELRPYQQEALAAVEAAQAKGVNRQLIVMATGLGKTVVFSHLVPGRTPTLVLAHREELLSQARDKILAVNPELSVEIEQGQNYAGRADVVVASVATLGRAGTDRLGYFPPDYFRLVVVDEAHHAAAESYRRVLDYFDTDLRVGVTATPQRGDSLGLYNVFDEVVYFKSILDGIEEGWLAPLRGYRVNTGTDITGVSTTGGDYAEGELGAALNNEDRNKILVDAYHDLVPGKRTMVFCAGVDHAESVTESFNAAGIRAACVIGTTPADERAATFRAFRNGDIKVFVNVGVATEGFDEPAVEAIFLARPTKSVVLFTQVVGRGTRTHPGKEYCAIVDFCDVTKGKKPVGVPSLLGLPSDYDLEGNDLVEESKKFKALEELSPDLAAGVKNADDIDEAYKRIDLFTPPPPSETVLAYSKLIWAEIGEESWWLNLNSRESIHISGDPLGRFTVVLKGQGSAEQTLGVCPDVQAAFVNSDRWVQKNRKDSLKLLDSDAVWRGGDVTEKQVKFLKRIGIPVTKDMTRGQASAIIDRYIQENPKPPRPAWLERKIQAGKTKW